MSVQKLHESKNYTKIIPHHQVSHLKYSRHVIIH